MKKLIINYNRESTKQQVENGYNLVEQERKARDYIQFEGFAEKVLVLNEYGESAKSLKRTKMKELIKLIKSGQVSKLIVYSLDRLTRRLSDLDYLLRLFCEYDVEFIAIKDKIDLSSAVGRFFVHIIGSIAEWEQDTISERTLSGMVGGARLGNYVLGGKPPFGYKRLNKIVFNEGIEIKRKTLVFDEEKIELVKQIFQWANEGYSPFSIRTMIKSDSRFKNINHTFSDDMLRVMINNPVYHGEIKINGDYYRIDVETLFTKEEHQKIIQNSFKHCRQHINQFVFKDKVYDVLGERLVHSSSNKTLASGELKIYKYYESQQHQRISENKIMDKVVEYVKDNQNDFLSLKVGVVSRISKIEKERKELFRLLENQDISFDSYVEKMKILENKLKQLQKEKQEVKEELNIDSICSKVKRITVDLKRKSLIKVDFY